MTSPLKRNLVLKLETDGIDGPIVVERKLIAKWESIGPMLEAGQPIVDIEDFLKDVIKVALVEFVEAEGKDMLTELISKAAAER